MVPLPPELLTFLTLSPVIDDGTSLTSRISLFPISNTFVIIAVSVWIVLGSHRSCNALHASRPLSFLATVSLDNSLCLSFLPIHCLDFAVPLHFGGCFSDFQRSNSYRRATSVTGTLGIPQTCKGPPPSHLMAFLETSPQIVPVFHACLYPNASSSFPPLVWLLDISFMLCFLTSARACGQRLALFYLSHFNELGPHRDELHLEVRHFSHCVRNVVQCSFDVQYPRCNCQVMSVSFITHADLNRFDIPFLRWHLLTLGFFTLLARVTLPLHATMA